ncbi:hypothetical protein GXM_08841 [Nostoc sphaeroides CCNUC1]|uniref:Uncharacterized protein n=1 Tax=Nostoc sphaeroides CCNUC1 TaxID=2653204 RepID=A0A5P8WEU4_9NOSO|nr:hypothetical protein GXM_08841 [Nostoc sphaeroides CCNUC1]
MDAKAEIHEFLRLYRGLSIQFPLLSSSQKAWLISCTWK